MCYIGSEDSIYGKNSGYGVPMEQFDEAIRLYRDKYVNQGDKYKEAVCFADQRLYP